MQSAIKLKKMRRIFRAQRRSSRISCAIIERIRKRKLLEMQTQLTYLIEPMCKIKNSNLPCGSLTNLREELVIFRTALQLKTCNMPEWHFGMRISV